jgi:hypothetical protein
VRQTPRLATFPDEQDLAGAVQRRGRLGLHPGERLAGAPLDAGDARHGVARGERIAEPGGDQQVADADVGAVGQEGQVHAR